MVLHKKRVFASKVGTNYRQYKTKKRNDFFPRQKQAESYSTLSEIAYELDIDHSLSCTIDRDLKLCSLEKSHSVNAQ